jgi:hypothetical protein
VEDTVSFTVKNAGKRGGTEIAQVYASLPDAAGEPPKRLIGWARVELAAGESAGARFPRRLGLPQDVQYLAGHSNPMTKQIQNRRRQWRSC